MAGCAEKQNLCTGRLRGLVNISQYNSHICYALIKLEENEAREATATSMLAIPHGFRPHHAFVVDLESGTVLVHVEGAKRVLMVRPENILPAPCTSAKCMPRGRRDADEDALRAALRRLPKIGQVEELLELVIDKLRIDRVDQSAVRAIGASSTAKDGRSSMHNVLKPDANSWWMSAPGSCRFGQGSEFVTVQLSPSAAPVRVERVAMMIPPLPSGPLAVRIFHLDRADHPQGPWTRCSDNFFTLDSARLQEWALEKFVEARYLRVVGTCSAIAGGGTKLARRDTIIRADSMGFLSVSFH